MQELRANTQVIVPIGPFVDKGDGFTPQVDITLGGDEAELLKHGSVTVVDISGATWAAVANCRGYYGLTLTTSHTDTEGMLTVIVQDDSDCLPVRQSFMVLSEAAWDSKYAAKDDGFMDVNIKTVGRADTQETEANNLESACAAWSATRGLAGTALPAAVADAAGGVPISDAGGLALDTILDVAISTRLAPTTAARTLDVAVTGEVGLDFNNIKNATAPHTLTNVTVPVVTTNSDMRGTESAALAATALSTAVWTAARAGALTDWIDGGRLDLLLDGIPTTAEFEARTVGATAASLMNLVYTGLAIPVVVAAYTDDGDFTLTGANLSASDNTHNDQYLVFTAGNNLGVARSITEYTAATKRVQFTGDAGDDDEEFPNTVAVADTGFIIGLSRPYE